MAEHFEPFIDDDATAEPPLEPEYEPGRDLLGRRQQRVAKVGGDTAERIIVTPYWMLTDEHGAKSLRDALNALTPPAKLGELFDVTSAGGGLFAFRRIGMPIPANQARSQILTPVRLEDGIQPIVQYSKPTIEQVRKETRSMLGKLAGMTTTPKKRAASSANLKKAREARWAKARAVAAEQPAVAQVILVTQPQEVE